MTREEHQRTRTDNEETFNGFILCVPVGFRMGGLKRQLTDGEGIEDVYAPAGVRDRFDIARHHISFYQKVVKARLSSGRIRISNDLVVWSDAANQICGLVEVARIQV